MNLTNPRFLFKNRAFLDSLLNCIPDLSGLSLQSGTSRLVKDEYSAGAVPGGGMVFVPTPGTMDVDGEGAGTIQHHPPGQPPSRNQYLHSTPSGM